MALAFARAGDIEQARSLEIGTRRERPRDILVQGYYSPVIDAAIRLQHKDPVGAVQALRPALQYDFAYVPSFGNL